MMSSSHLSLESGIPLITAIREALDDLDSMEISSPYDVEEDKVEIMSRLRNILVFVLCSRKMLGNDAHNDNYNKNENLRSLMARIEEAVCRNVLEFHNEYKISFHAIYLFGEMKYFDREIHEGYITLLDYWRQSSPLMSEGLVEIMDPILKNLVYSSTKPTVRRDVIIAVREKLTLLKNFVRFSTIQGIEQPQLGNLLAHVGAVTMSACSVGLFSTHSDDWMEEIPSRISALLEKIKPIDPQVYETYIQALTSSRLSRNVNDHTNLGLEYYDPIIVMKDFIDSLACNLWEALLLEQDSRLVVFEKDQLQMLYEGLRFLRTFLKEHPNTFDNRIRDLIAVAICDAGIVIFSLYQEGVEIDLTLVDLLERIKLIQAEVEEQVPETSKSNFPRTNELGFVDNLLANLMELCVTHNRVPAIHKELVSLRSFLGEIVELHNEHEQLQTLWDRVMELAHKIEFLIDHLLVGGDVSDSLSISFDSIMEDIRNIKIDDTLKLFYGKGQRIKVEKKIVATKSNDEASQNRALVIDDVVGFDNETIAIIDRLTRGSKSLRVVAIVGMAGLGKTTLAARVYNDRSITRHFHVRSWGSVSQIFHPKRVLLEILSHIDSNNYQEVDEDNLAEKLRHHLKQRRYLICLDDNNYQEMDEDNLAYLAEKLRRHLKQRRYLICLDDVWDIEVWKKFQGVFPDDSNGSRILLTSRVCDVTPQAMVDEGPLFLNHLTEDKSWELLNKKLFGERGCPSALKELGMKIAHTCKGLPLIITIVTGLLATMDQESWEEVLISLNSGLISSTEQCANSLALSYKHLPDHLKSCFLYFGVFLEDQQVLVKNLIQLWIAEGFVRKIDSKSLEDVAMDYVNDLVGRSMIMVARKRSLGGGVKGCRMHDLLYDFCKQKAKEEKFFHRLERHDELLAFNEPKFVRRLCIYSNLDHFVESKLYCPRVRTLLLFCARRDGDVYKYMPDHSFIPRIFRLLRVLDVREILLRDDFLSALLLLVELRFLAIKTDMKSIPPSIDRLLKLETLFLDPSCSDFVELPGTLWNLRRLRHLCMRWDNCAGFVLPIQNLDNSPDLNELVSFCGLVVLEDVREDMEKQLRKFPNIRKLKCMLFDCSSFQLSVLSGLESLGLKSYEHYRKWPLDLPANLKKLTLTGFMLPWGEIRTVGELPNLEVLKLRRQCFSGETWNVEQGEFLNLRFLQLENLDIVRWTASDDEQLRNLQSLVLINCWKLTRIPCSCLANVPTLEMIAVSRCLGCIGSSVEKIKDVQKEWGNSALKISISSFIPMNSDSEEWE